MPAKKAGSTSSLAASKRWHATFEQERDVDTFDSISDKEHRSLHVQLQHARLSVPELQAYVAALRYPHFQPLLRRLPSTFIGSRKGSTAATNTRPLPSLAARECSDAQQKEAASTELTWTGRPFKNHGDGDRHKPMDPSTARMDTTADFSRDRLEAELPQRARRGLNPRHHQRQHPGDQPRPKQHTEPENTRGRPRQALRHLAGAAPQPQPTLHSGQAMHRNGKTTRQAGVTERDAREEENSKITVVDKFDSIGGKKDRSPHMQLQHARLFTQELQTYVAALRHPNFQPLLYSDCYRTNEPLTPFNTSCRQG